MFASMREGQYQGMQVSIHYRVGGSGPPLLLLHGYPQSGLMWHKVAPVLQQHFTLVIPDLRGYGHSSKPFGSEDHATYSKRATAQDQIEVMQSLGFERFMVAGHDRGGRVAHRMALDHASRVSKIAVLDIVPTHYVFNHVDKTLATSYFHWFFLIQKYDFPERLISADPEYYLRTLFGKWGTDDKVFPPQVMQRYIEHFRDAATVHATCEDYRAGASIDLEHDEADLHVKLAQPLLVLWGRRGFVGNSYDPLEVWRGRAANVQGQPVDCGHFLPEEQPEETAQALAAFFRR